MTRYPSTAEDADWPFPTPQKPNASGHFTASVYPPHKIYWHEYGNPKGEPVFYIHGGPGGGTSAKDARYFDPKRYRIILFDQRGCGESIPSAANAPKDALAGNDTDSLISDIAALRDHLGITGKMHLFGGSWGSTLAAAYTMVHPEHVKSLTLRGIFLCRRKDLDYLYQGNAAHYPKDTGEPGAYQFNPPNWGAEFLKVVPPDKKDALEQMLADAWKNYVQAVPKAARGDMVKAYADIFAMEPKENSPEAALQRKAASAWSMWEGVASFVAPDLAKVKERFDDPGFAMAFGQIENRYFMNGGYLGGSGETHRDNNYLLDNIESIARLHIPINVIQGKYDRVCPRDQADDFVHALRAHGAEVNYVLTDAGHSATEFSTMQALTHAMEMLPRMKPWELAAPAAPEQGR
jgi:pimeloyl-ACP methyl ester carboxylesterase